VKTRLLKFAAGGIAAVCAQSGLPLEAAAHGSMEYPISRVYHCYKENPENPQSAACKAVVAAGGTQPLYDWNEVNQFDANGKHKALIPDGTLCGGGRDKYVGLDLGRKDWKKTKIKPNDNNKVEFVFHATAPHAVKYMKFYITKSGWDKKAPLTWNTLKKIKTARNVELDSDSRYRVNVKIPSGRSGRHVVYMIWQRSDSPEAFYSCSDVKVVN